MRWGVVSCGGVGRPVWAGSRNALAMLDEYERKRDFDKTPEPLSGKVGKGDLRFLVQKHAASRLHYDFRLEIDGVLKSWPVPKGPSLDPAQKRLAVMVEDHPLDYATFEGVIGHGNYGAGQVILWDAGTYSPDEDGRLSFGDRQEAEDRMRRGVEAGKLSFTLRGRKLRGSWTLVKTSRSPNDWLLIKHRDRYADTERDVLKEDRSVQSGLTIEDLKAGRMPDPNLSPGDRGRPGGTAGLSLEARSHDGPPRGRALLPPGLALRTEAGRLSDSGLPPPRRGEAPQPQRARYHREVPGGGGGAGGPTGRGDGPGRGDGRVG